MITDKHHSLAYMKPSMTPTETMKVANVGVDKNTQIQKC